MLNQWEQLKVREGLVYRRARGPGEQAVLQLLVPRRIVQEVIRTSHEGQTGGPWTKSDEGSIGLRGKQIPFCSAEGVRTSMNTFEAN